METDEGRTAAGRLTAATAPAVDAATVVLLRDRPGVKAASPDAADHDRSGDHDRAGDPCRAGDLEVLLLERHLDSDFAGGALVFPGGKVDDADRSLDAARWIGRPLPARRPVLGAASDQDALGLLVAAVRETFEEAGVLLARREDGTLLTADDLSGRAFVEARRRLASRDERWDWRPWLEDEGVTLDLGALALWSWWVTPEGQHKRFDTRFMVARLPSGQAATHDEVETTALRWLSPGAALDAQRRGEAVVIFPTRRNLAALAAYPSADEAWQAAARGDVDQRRLQPRLVVVDGQTLVQHPDEDVPEPI